MLLLLPMFYLLLQLLSLLKIIKFCRRLSTFVFVYFYCNPHTYKISLPVNTIIFFCLFYRYFWNYKIALPVAIILVLFNWRTGKTKIHILLYTMQHCINFYNYTTFIQLFINFINSNFKNYRHCKCQDCCCRCRYSSHSLLVLGHLNNRSVGFNWILLLQLFLLHFPSSSSSWRGIGGIAIATS